MSGKTWGTKGQTPVVERPGQAAADQCGLRGERPGGFWYCTYRGGLSAQSFVSLLRRMMRRRSKPVHSVLDGLASTTGMLTLHFLPGYAPGLNPVELFETT